MDFLHKEESWSRDQIVSVQNVRLQTSLYWAYQSPFYHQRFNDMGVGLDELLQIEKIEDLPFTSKDDLRAGYPFSFLSVGKEEIVRLHASSGTTGTPTVIHHTQSDLDVWADLMARCMHMVGLRSSDILQNMSGYGLFTGGLGIHAGAERLGCLTVPAGAGNTRRQLKFIQDLQVTALHILPSYALYLGRTLAEYGLRAEDLSPRIALIGAEPHTEEVRKRIESLLCLKAYNSYGLSEMNGPGVAFECLEQNGMHVWEDAFYPEIIDPSTGQAVAEGEYGELVLSTLIRRGMPLLRYRTRDITRFLPGECPCGRKHRRIDRITGRVDDLFIIKGCNIYPMQIEQVLMGFPEVSNNYFIILERENDIEQIRVQVEINDSYFVEDVRLLQDLQRKISHRLRDEILVTPKVELVAAKTLAVTEGKAKRLEDRRE